MLCVFGFVRDPVFLGCIYVKKCVGFVLVYRTNFAV